MLTRFWGGAIACAVLVFGGWLWVDNIKATAHDDGYKQAQAEYTAKAIAAEKAARATETAWSKKYEQAQNDHAVAAQSLRNAAATARIAADSLRKQLAATASFCTVSSTTPSPSIDPESTLKSVLGECVGRYTEVVADADQLQAENAELRAAWP